jgi:hypothetical protein
MKNMTVAAIAAAMGEYYARHYKVLGGGVEFRLPKGIPEKCIAGKCSPRPKKRRRVNKLHMGRRKHEAIESLMFVFVYGHILSTA